MRNKRNKRPISKNAVCATKTIYICSSAVFCILGVFLFMIGKTGTIRHAWIICSICLILHGCIEINGHHIKDLYMLAFKNGSYVGVLCILMGIIILFFVRGHTDCLYVLLGTGLLADALEKISGVSTRRSMAQATEATAHMFIACPFSKRDMSTLFSTHPAMSERIRLLRKQAEEMRSRGEIDSDT